MMHFLVRGRRVRACSCGVVVIGERTLWPEPACVGCVSPNAVALAQGGLPPLSRPPLTTAAVAQQAHEPDLLADLIAAWTAFDARPPIGGDS